MAELEFEVSFIGAQIDGGGINARELAASLIALSDLIRETNRLVHPTSPPVVLDIRGTRRGSFVIELLMRHQELRDFVVDMFSSDEASALANLLEIIFAGHGGVLWLMRRVGGGGVRRLETVAPTEQARLELPDGTVASVDREVVAAYDDVTIRRTVRDFTSPLEGDAVDAIEVRSETVEIRLSRGERAHVVASAECAEELPAAERQVERYRGQPLTVVQASLERDLMWRLRFGDIRFSAEILDNDFIDDVITREHVFGHSDVLICDFDLTYREGERRRASGRVHRVREHRPQDRPEEPPRLFDVSGD